MTSKHPPHPKDKLGDRHGYSAPDVVDVVEKTDGSLGTRIQRQPLETFHQAMPGHAELLNPTGEHCG